MKGGNGRSGQAVVLLLALLVAMAAMVFWMTDVHTLLMRKLRIQDGGDAACLAAARWQAAGLNLVGELNLIRAYMISAGLPREEVEAVYELQQRVALTTPFLAMLAAQQAARENACAPWPEETTRAVRDYFNLLGGLGSFEGYHEAAREDFLAMTDILFGDGMPIYAMPAVAVFESSTPLSLLLMRDFYEAVLANDRCWFLRRQELLRTYAGPKSFGPLPELRTDPPFGLLLAGFESSLEELEQPVGTAPKIGMDGIRMQLARLRHPAMEEPQSDEDRKRRGQNHMWMGFDRNRWTPWYLIDDLPMRAEVRACYDYQGPAAVVAVRSEDGTAGWLAAAKALGEVGGDRPNDYPLVLGGFDRVRLIPIDAADRGLTALDPDWLTHLVAHLQEFVSRGTLAEHTCRYCRALRIWSTPAFRFGTLEWLRLYGHTCRQNTDFEGGGSASETGGNGGTSFAH